MRSMMQDVRYALRRLRKSPGFMLTVVAVPAPGLGVRTHDALTFSAEALVLAASSFLAAWIPARRAASVDPILVLRSE